jgi:hypothetical protein
MTTTLEKAAVFAGRHPVRDKNEPRLQSKGARKPMPQNITKAVLTFSFGLLLYAVVMMAYAFGVLAFLGDWLFQLFRTEQKLYAVTALALIIGQGLISEILARTLLGLIKGAGGK